MYSHEFDYDSEKKGCFVTKPKGCLMGIIFIGTLVALIALGVLYGQKISCGNVSQKDTTPTAGALTGAPPSPTGTPTTTQGPVIKLNYRLPRNFKPTHYDIMVGSELKEPDLQFFGSVKIHIDCVKNSSVIVIHSKGLEIDYNTVKLIHENTTIPSSKLQISQNNITDFLNINFEEMLQAGQKYQLEIGAFNGSLIQSDLRGFYNSSYILENQRINLAATQFEATHARRAFPCFDEPEWKATFRVKIQRPYAMNSLSNARLLGTSNVSELLQEDEYDHSLFMSCYLVAFAISDFVSEERSYTQQNNPKYRVKFSSWARSNAINNVKYSLDVGEKLLEYFENTFKSDYQLTKLDMIALPDFDAGAMENWGLITYRETALLFDEKRPTAVAKKRVATVVAHEILHQWFGNLVTCVWWNQIWLNEGFARYFQYESTDVAEKDWKVKDHFFVDDMQDVLEIDSLDSTHPIYQDVSTPSEIWSLFDRISYGKGGWLIRMMESFLGRETLFEGLVNYLKNNAYNVVDQERLFKELTAAANYTIDVNLTMKSWTFEKGYPLITVERNYLSGLVNLTQKRFRMRPIETAEDQKSPLWEVYIVYKTVDEPKKEFWLTTETTYISDPLLVGKNWLLLNVDMYGMYRVNYDEQNWKLLEDQLNSDYMKINTLNRAQILEDALTFARIGLVKYTLALDLVKYLQTETEYVPWAAGRRGLNFLRDIISSTEHYGQFQRAMRTLIEKLYESEKDYLDRDASQPLNFTKEYIASLAVNIACENDYPACIKRLKQFYEERKSTPIPPYIFGSVYCIAVSSSEQSTWNEVFEEYKATQSAQDKVTLLGALACTQDTVLLNRFMNMASQENQDIKSQDVRYVFAGVARTEIGRTEFWEFLQKNWGRLKTQFKFALSSTISVALNAWVSTSSSKKSLNELKAFMQKYKDDIGESQTLTNTFKQVHDKLQLNVEWREEYLPEVITWYENFLNPVQTTLIADTTVQVTTTVTTQTPTSSAPPTTASMNLETTLLTTVSTISSQ